jgi:asparagine synthase (glutamine-hydrolysing)
MSIIFGIRRPEGSIVTERQLMDIGQYTDRWAPDGTGLQVQAHLGMGFQPYHTHRRSNLERRPILDEHGNMVAFDGRLDNYKELCVLLGIENLDTADSWIVLAAFERWGEECFRRLVGDWSLALWCHSNRSLYLARDHAGTRTLYFEERGNTLVWGTFLETFFAESTSCPLCHNYATQYLSCKATGDLTPYEGITAIPPAHFVVFREDKVIRKVHWEWIIRDTVRYRDDREYEEHFVSLLTEAVARRTTSGEPVIAELSGGMDSSSIVCVSDRIRRSRDAKPCELIDTVSYYDDSEATWNEEPYFTSVETLRGKAGVHFKTSPRDRSFLPVSTDSARYFFPGVDSGTALREAAVDKIMARVGYRIIISGLGGDELLGGFPNPNLELGDALIGANVPLFVRQCIEWALLTRVPLIFLLRDVCQYLIHTYGGGRRIRDPLTPWIVPSIAGLRSEMFHMSTGNLRNGPIRPSAISNGITWWYIMESLPHRYPAFNTRREYRYPLLDRDLVEFMFKIPRDQIQKPGRRRSLQRRALAQLVPDLILERRRKAFMQHGSLLTLQRAKEDLQSLFRSSVLVQRGFLDPKRLQEGIVDVTAGTKPEWRHALLRAINLELWLATANWIT